LSPDPREHAAILGACLRYTYRLGVPRHPVRFMCVGERAAMLCHDQSTPCTVAVDKLNRQATLQTDLSTQESILWTSCAGQSCLKLLILPCTSPVPRGHGIPSTPGTKRSSTRRTVSFTELHRTLKFRLTHLPFLWSVTRLMASQVCTFPCRVFP
jgi:hypothetical protein